MSVDRLNKETFGELQALMGEAMADFLDTFMDNSPQLIHKMEAALTSGDTESLFHGAHQLKGGSGSIGATQLADLCLQIEQLGQAGSMQGVTDLLKQLNAEYEQLVVVLKTYL